ncbi:response regulator [bacterium]|nr:response regulator [bacterium]
MESGRPKRILTIEDDPAFIRLLETRLKAKGYEVHTVTDGLQALNAVRKLKPDLIITDLLLPGMDGHKICRMIKFDKTTSHIPVIMLTARDLDKEAELAKQCRADLFISKTNPIDVWISRIPKMLDRINKKKTQPDS